MWYGTTSRTGSIDCSPRSNLALVGGWRRTLEGSLFRQMMEGSGDGKCSGRWRADSALKHGGKACNDMIFAILRRSLLVPREVLASLVTRGKGGEMIFGSCESGNAFVQNNSHIALLARSRFFSLHVVEPHLAVATYILFAFKGKRCDLGPTMVKLSEISNLGWLMSHYSFHLFSDMTT